MNLLILSCGTRNILVSYFKESGFDKVVVTDCSKLAPALYVADSYHIVPRMDSPQYLYEILRICDEEDIQAVLPLQEDELHFLSTQREIFAQKDILPIVSNVEAIDICRDKMNFYYHMKKNNLPILQSYDLIDDFETRLSKKEESFPVFVKPVRGAGSVGTMKVTNMDLLNALIQTSEEPLMIQRFAKGTEYGADIYVDILSGEVTDIFVKEKIRMRAGETEKSVSIKNNKLFELIIKTIKTLDLSGPIDMDIFEIDGEFYISEINPRFGGGYPHAYACGVNFPKKILSNVSGQITKDHIGQYEEGVYAMKYSDIIIKESL